MRTPIDQSIRNLIRDEPKLGWSYNFIIHDGERVIGSTEPTILRDWMLKEPETKWTVWKFRTMDIFDLAGVEHPNGDPSGSIQA